MIPYFSICIPAYNAAKYLEATIDSVLRQSFEDFEIVIINNGSTDNTASLISKYVDERIKVFTNAETIPPHENWTRSVQMAKGKWVKLLCADDLLKPDALDKIHDDLQNHREVKIHVGLRDIIDDFGKIVRPPKARFSEGTMINLDDIVSSVLNSGTNPLGESMCVTWENGLTKEVGAFSSAWNYFIDLDYWLRLAKTSEIYYSTAVLGSFRVSSSSWTSSIGFGAIREAKNFFELHEEIRSSSIHRRKLAILLAIFRSISRQLFLTVVLRKNLK